LATASKGYVRVQLSCERAACTGGAEITEQVLLKHHKSKAATERETVVLAKTSYYLSRGESATVRLKQTDAGLTLFADAKSHPTKGRLVVSVRHGTELTRAVLIS
jgi:hypothetical protein